MAGDELMKNILGIPMAVVWFLAVVILFIGFNVWLMGQVEHVVGNEVKARRPVRALAAVPSGAYIPVIDRENDLLAPVANVLSPQIYLKRLPQKNTDEREYGLPMTGKILTD
jgi:phosphoglycerol transferase MdoB-like AlkP superfamily enzyme